MASLGRPGVYLQETTVQQTTPLTDRTDAIAAFVGSTARGPITPGIVSSWSDFVKAYGGLDYNYPTTIAAYMFFSNGGRDAYVRRVVSTDSVTATRTLKQADGSTDAVTVKATNPGAWGNALNVQVTASDAATKKFSISVFGAPLTISGGSGTTNLLEQFNDLSLDSSSSRYAIAIVNAFSNYISLTAISGNSTFVPPAYSASVAALTTGSDGSAVAGTDISLSLTDFDVVNAPLLFNAPDIATLAGASGTKAAAITAQAALLRYAEARGDGFVIVDTPSGLSAFDAQTYASDVYNAATAASATVSSYTVSAATPSTPATGQVTYTTGSTPHNFIAGQTVTLAGITNSADITGTAASVVRPGYQGATQVAGFVTITTAAAHGFKNGDTVVVSGITNTISGNSTVTNAYNGTYTVTIVDTTNFYFANANTGTVTTLTSAKAISSGYSGKFTITSVPSTVTFVTSNTESGTAVLSTATASVTNTWTTSTASGANAAMYYPWLAIPDTSKSVPGITKNVAPGGAILGVYQDTDASRGVFKSPAGYAATIAIAVDLELDSAGKPRRLTNDQLDTLNTAVYPVNPIRVAPGAGIVVMGARTLNNVSPNRYVNMRRSMIYIKKQIELRSQFAVFENNDEYLWRQLRSSLSNFLNMYWQQGGLRGATPEQAFYVKCDGVTTGDIDIANGQVNIQIGVALEYPAEFVVINIGQLTGSATAF
jgi:phage tail sheath protein FI